MEIESIEWVEKIWGNRKFEVVWASVILHVLMKLFWQSIMEASKESGHTNGMDNEGQVLFRKQCFWCAGELNFIIYMEKH